MPSSADAATPPRVALAWLGLSVALAAGSLAALAVPAATWDWQPGRALDEPWRWWTAAFVHWSPRHLLANLAGCALVGALGRVAALPPASALAWAGAWPLTHVALRLRPELAHYGGLSGVLHAGVAVAAVHLAIAGRGRRRAVGVALLAGLAAKLAGEQPWGPVLRHPAHWDIAIAPLAHATGAIAGAACALLAAAAGRQRLG